jgi:aminopeptidase N
LTLSLEQMIPATPGQSTKEPMHIPLRFALISENGSEASASAISGGDVTGDVLHLTQRAQTFTFSGIGSRPVVSLNRGFSAPVTLHFAQSAEDLGHIARHDSDLFARWQAITDLALPVLTDAAKTARDGGSVTTSPAFIDVLLAVAADEALEPAFRAQALSLPSEADIARELGGNNDPDAIHAGRQAVLGAIATAGADVFRKLYATHSASGPFSPDAAGAGKRALKNLALSFLSLAENSPALAAEAFAKADNMTDVSQALTILAHRFPDAAETKAALAAFETRFASNALVLDKWFTIQATIPGAASLERVKALMASPHFQPSNPNRVRSLVGTFAFGNATGFNRADGAAYTFFAEQILAIDPRNPQLAARLLTAMRSWRLLEPGRADKARAALSTIEASSTLSTDVRDIVERILKG